uniref:Jacalin-type lectin domain-containing protein n=1 Tax=Kalanchoe fedtschenkoi TaxID=63787 RepID=A0A7N0VD17_KALFE
MSKSIREMIKLGPVGQPGEGKSWDEKGRSQIYQMFISYGVDMLNGLQFQYVEKGSLVLSDPLGNMAGANFKLIKLDYPSEYITWVKIKKSLTGIRWLAFKTNLGNLHGPFPPTSLKPDAYKRISDDEDMLSTGFDLGNDNQFGGFYGTYDSNTIRSLGIYVQPMSSMKTASASQNGDPVPGLK